MFGASGDPVNVTPVTAVGLMTMFVAWFANVLSELVCTRKFALAPATYVAAAGFTTRGIATVAAVVAFNAQVRLGALASVTVTVLATLVAVPVQPRKVAPSVTGTGPAGGANAAWNCTVIVPPAASAPVADEVNPTVHVVGVFARPVFAAEPLKVIAVGGAASAIRGSELRSPAMPIRSATRTARGARSIRTGLVWKRGIECVSLFTGPTSDRSTGICRRRCPTRLHSLYPTNTPRSRHN